MSALLMKEINACSICFNTTLLPFYTKYTFLYQPINRELMHNASLSHNIHMKRVKVHIMILGTMTAL